MNTQVEYKSSDKDLLACDIDNIFLIMTWQASYAWYLKLEMQMSNLEAVLCHKHLDAVTKYELSGRAQVFKCRLIILWYLL